MMEFSQESLFLTLSSGGITDSNSESVNDFSMPLYKTLHLTKDHYEVGLVQCIYKPTNDIFNPPLNEYYCHVRTEGESIARFFTLSIIESVKSCISFQEVELSNI
jgi:hypothetical protein